MRHKYSLDDVIDLNLPTSKRIEGMDVNIEWVVDGIIPKHANTMIYSEGGVGKSLLMLQIATAVANGESIFGLNVTKCPVTYIDFENPLAIVVDRVRKIGGSTNLKVWHLDHTPPPYHLDTDKWEIYRAFDPGLFIFDSLRSTHHLDENSSQDVSLLMERLKFIRGEESTIVLIHNENKTGDFRGSSSLVDLCDQILAYGCVENIGDDKEVPVVLTKSTIRRFSVGGKHRFDTPIIKYPLYLTLMPDGRLNNATPTIKEERLLLVKEMLDRGATQTEVGDFFNVSQQAVSKWITKLRKMGMSIRGNVDG